MPPSEVGYDINDIDLIELIGDAAKVEYSLYSRGVTLKARCPFHSERTPSFYITKRYGYAPDTWHCHGGCELGGTAVEYVMKRDNCDVNEAHATLAAWAKGHKGNAL